MVKLRTANLRTVYRAGTSDGKVPPGLYATFLKRANDCFEKARGYAELAGRAIDHPIRYYQTGEYAEVAFGNGCRTMPLWTLTTASSKSIATHAARREAREFVTITDKPLTTAMKKLAGMPLF